MVATESPPLLVERVDVLVEDKLVRVDVLGGVGDGEIRERGGRGAHAVGVAAVQKVDVPCSAAGLALLVTCGTHEPQINQNRHPIPSTTAAHSKNRNTR